MASLSDYFGHGMNIAMGVAGAYAGFTTGNPFLAYGSIAGAIGREAEMLNTSRSRTGPSDAEMERYETTARTALAGQTRRREQRASRRIGAQAGQGRTLSSGLAVRDFGAVAEAGDAERAQTEGEILRGKAALTGQRRYGMNVGKLGMAGRGVSSAAAPLTMLGSAILAKRYGFGGPGYPNPSSMIGEDSGLTSPAQDWSADYGDVFGSAGYGGRQRPIREMDATYGMRTG